MLLSYFIELFFSLLIVFLTYQIISNVNVVKSVLFLILLAIIFSLFLFFYKVDFLAVLYLAVYIGAVTVFFLFVVMMTDLNDSLHPSLAKKNSFNLKRNLYLIFVSLLSISIANLILNLFSISNQDWQNNNTIYFANLDSFNLNIENLGFSMFSEHSGPFILISIIILITLVGAILITTLINESFDNNIVSKDEMLSKAQDMEQQVSRNLLNTINLSSTKHTNF